MGLDPYRLLARAQRFFRSCRMRRMQAQFDLAPTTRVLDVGGYRQTWDLLDTRPDVTLLNLHVPKGADGSTALVIADARQLPFPDDAFDVCFSNSVIEHVGGPDDIARFAAEVRRVAPRHHVQTPDRRFPVEPHVVGLFVQHLPRWLRRPWVRWFSLWGLVRRPSGPRIDAMLDGIHLLTAEDMRALFPDSTIEHERVLGLSKSLIAVRR